MCECVCVHTHTHKHTNSYGIYNIYLSVSTSERANGDNKGIVTMVNKIQEAILRSTNIEIHKNQTNMQSFKE